MAASPETDADHPVGDDFPSAVSWKLILTSTLGHAASTTETLSVVAGNAAPNAGLTSDIEEYITGQTVTFDASSSSDPDGDALSYEWSLQSPEGSEGSLEVNEDNQSEATFTPTATGDYTVSVTVSDGLLSSDPATIDFTVSSSNTKPTAVVEYRHLGTEGGFVAAASGESFAVPMQGQLDLTAHKSTDQETTGGQPDIGNGVIDLIYRLVFVSVPGNSVYKLLGGLTNPPVDQLNEIGLAELITFGPSFEWVSFAPDVPTALGDFWRINVEVEDPITAQVTVFNVIFTIQE
jgi:hypothetical protein